MGKDNILVIVQTQYQTLGLFTEEDIIEDANVSWEPKGPFYIFEFFREKEQKIPPTRYVNTVGKAYTFSNDTHGAVIMFSNAFKIEKKTVSFFQRGKLLVDQDGHTGCFLGGKMQKEELKRIVICQLTE